MTGHYTPLSGVSDTPVEDYFSWDGKEGHDSLLNAEELNNGNRAAHPGPSPGIKHLDRTKFLLPPQWECEAEEHAEEYYDAPGYLLTWEEKARIQKWVDEQPSCYAGPNILTPRSPRVQSPFATHFLGLAPSSVWSSSRSAHSGPGADIESGAIQGRVLEIAEECRDSTDGGLSAERNLAFCDRCGAYLGAPVGSAGGKW